MHAALGVPGWPSLDPLPGAAVPQRLRTPEAPPPVAWWKVQQEAERRAAQELEYREDRHRRHRAERGSRCP